MPATSLLEGNSAINELGHDVVPNRELIQHITEAFLKGDIAAVQDYLDEDIVGYFSWAKRAGVFHGKEAVLKHLSGPSRLGVHFELTSLAFFVDEKYGAVLYEVTATRKGKVLTETRVMVCTIDNGKVIETRIYPSDQYTLDKFWSGPKVYAQ